MNEQKFHVAIKVLILNKNNHILVLKTNLKNLKGNTVVHWDLPGGRIKESNSIQQTLENEIKAELGIRLTDITIIKLFDASISNIKIPIGNIKFGLVLFTYLCRINKKGLKIKLSYEHTEYKWVDIKEATRLLSFKFSTDFINKLAKTFIEK